MSEDQIKHTREIKEELKNMPPRREISDNQEKLLYKILQATSENGKTIQSIDSGLGALTERYVSESEFRDMRISKLESRTERLSLIIAAELFVISTLMVAVVGYLISLL